MVDRGVSYAGKPTRLVFSYDSTGRPLMAVCAENPKVKFDFNPDWTLAEYGLYCVSYNTDGFDSIDRERDITDKNAFSPYVKKKMQLVWELVTTGSPDFAGDEIFQPVPTANYTRDTTGNWTQAQWYGPLEYDDDGNITITRVITYGDPQSDSEPTKMSKLEKIKQNAQEKAKSGVK